MCNSSKKLPGEVTWFKELSELCDNYDLATTEFCCDNGILRQDIDGSDSFTCCGSYGCGSNYSSSDISKDCVIWQFASCSKCYDEAVFPLEEEYFICEKCEGKLEDERDYMYDDYEDEDENEEEDEE